MSNKPRQQVFPFLADDPFYRREVREQQIVADVTEALLPVLRESMTELACDLARNVFKEQLESMIAAAVKEATKGVVADVRGELCDIIESLVVRLKDDSDPADWWKKGTELDEDEGEMPF